MSPISAFPNQNKNILKLYLFFLNFGIPAIALAAFLGIVQEAGVSFTVN